MIVCGIDPGLEGGITFLEYDAAKSREIHVESISMPTLDLGKKRVLDARQISLVLASRKIDRLRIEKVGAMPGQGVTSMFSFGYGAGLIEGVVACLGISYSLIIPQTWMKSVLSGLPKGEGTKSSILWCQRTFPAIDWRKTPKCKKPHDGKTDATCIAWYALMNQ